MELEVLRIVLIFFLCPSTAQVVQDETKVEVDNRRALLIGVDGLRPDALKKVAAELRKEGRYPHFLDLFDRGVVDYSIYAGGEVGESSEQETTSGPGWATILTGVWAARHSIHSDADMSAGKFNDRYPTLFNYVGNLFPEFATVAFINWWPLSTFVKTKAQGPKPREVHARRSDDLADYIQNDEFLVDEAIRSLQEDRPKFLFLHLGAVEQTGLTKGFGPDNARYIAAVKSKASQINALMREIEAQRRRRALDWLVVLTTDHGGHGRRSGTQQKSDRSVFALIQNPAHPEYTGGREISSYLGIDALAPTIVDFLAPHKFQPRSRRYKYLGEPIIASGTVCLRRLCDGAWILVLAQLALLKLLR